MEDVIISMKTVSSISVKNITESIEEVEEQCKL
jgi:hypothetical protein